LHTVLQHKFTRDLLQLLPHYFPVYQLKFETDCIAAAVVVSLCVPRDHNYLELLMRWSMFVSTNRPEHANPFILIAGKDFGTQNGTQEFKNMLLLFYLDWWTRFLNPKCHQRRRR
jgi:hypothetical protein